MGIFDRIKETAGEHVDTVDHALDTGIDRAGKSLDTATGSRFADQVDQGQALAKEHDDRLGDLLTGPRGQVPPVEGAQGGHDLPGEDVLDALGENPPPQG